MKQKTALALIVLAGALSAAQLESVPADSTAKVPAQEKPIQEKPVQDTVKTAKAAVQTETPAEVVKVVKRKPRTGGAGGIELGFTSMDLKPFKAMILRREVEELTLPASDTNSLRIAGLEFTKKIDDRELFPTIGFTGYASGEHGIRIGGTTRVSAQYFTAQRSDSLFTMVIGDAWAGVLLEKAFYPSPKTSVTVGGHGGAGAMGTIIFGEKGTGSGLKENSSDLDTANTQNGSGDALLGGTVYGMTELHAGVSYSVLKWLHLGASVNSQFSFSPRGFNWTDGFRTSNPGALLKITFGSAG